MAETMRGDRGAGRRGAGRRRDVAHPKGRQVDPKALEEVRALLGDRPRRRDLLIEHLHLVQDRFGGLSADHLAALAHEMRLAMAEVYEVATFYAHFDVLEDGDVPRRAVAVRVCDSITCAMLGADALIEGLVDRLPGDVRLLRAPCMGRCDRAPVAVVGQRHVESATTESVVGAVEAGRVEPVLPEGAVGYSAYVEAGGYRLLREALSGARDREATVEAVEASGLRGLGGAGFKSGQKWRLVRQAPKPRLMAINADEGEPGTFKDRFYLEREPHRFLEGMLLAAWAVEAKEVYIYLRDEYPHIRELLLREIAALGSASWPSPLPPILLRRGAGAYICGEETAMLESLEGKRGYPRHKPPFPTQVGLFGRPTLIHNVETVYWVRDILERGPDWFSGEGRHGRQGLRSFSVSGRVRMPGVKLAPAGITAQELIDEYCGGMSEGHTFAGYLPGGASGGILPAHMADIPLDFGALETHGCFIGSAALIVFSHQDEPRDLARNLMRFFEHESCGQCTPCRVGTEKASELMARPEWDEALLTELSAAMRDASICGLGQAAPNPLLSVLRHFPEAPR
jgi:NADH:ubiquinone oxidoreductase subunit F (NADH-binding)/NADH:ubiquinone oxidoreductase subunit E